MGLGLSFAQGEGPRFARMRDEAAWPNWPCPTWTSCGRVRRGHQHPQGAQPDGKGPRAADRFSGSPWTLACYMVEGAGSDDYRLVKTLMYSRPDLMHRILAINADAVAAYLNAQIDAGAQAVMVFDSWGGCWPTAPSEFSLAYTARVLAQLKRTRGWPTIPRIVFTKGGGLWLDDMGRRWTATCWAWTGP